MPAPPPSIGWLFLVVCSDGCGLVVRGDGCALRDCRLTRRSSCFVDLVGLVSLTIESSQPFEVLNLDAHFGH